MDHPVNIRLLLVMRTVYGSLHQWSIMLHSQFLRTATNSSIRKSSTFMFYRINYYETFLMKKTGETPLLSVATIGSLIRQPNVYKMGLASLLVDTVLSTWWWCTQSKINFDIVDEKSRGVVYNSLDKNNILKSIFCSLRLWEPVRPGWYDERRPGSFNHHKTWEQPVNFNWLIYCPLICSRAKLDQRDQKFDFHRLLYPIRNRIDNRWSNLITNNTNQYIIEPFSPSSIQNISHLPIPP